MALCLIVLQSSESYAATSREINVSVDVTLKNFYNNVKGAKEYLKTAKGVLVFPSVYKAGFGIRWRIWRGSFTNRRQDR